MKNRSARAHSSCPNAWRLNLALCLRLRRGEDKTKEKYCHKKYSYEIGNQILNDLIVLNKTIYLVNLICFYKLTDLYLKYVKNISVDI